MMLAFGVLTWSAIKLRTKVQNSHYLKLKDAVLLKSIKMCLRRWGGVKNTHVSVFLYLRGLVNEVGTVIRNHNGYIYISNLQYFTEMVRNTS